MSNNAIEINTLSKVYINNDKTENWALKDISFEVKKGEILGIVGANGSGKSTLLKILSSIIKPSQGKAILNGRIASVLEIGAGFHPDLNGLDNLKFKMQLVGVSKSERTRMIEEIIDFSNLEKYINYPVKNYSSGMFMRLALSTYLVLPYDILLIDEVFSAGDLVFQNKVNEKISEKIKSGVSGLLVSHELNVLEKNTDSCLWLEGGQIRELADTNIILENYRMYSILKSSNAKFHELDKHPINNVFENDVCALQQIRLIKKQAHIYPVDGFKIELKVKIIKEGLKIGFVLCISDFIGNFIHCDSPSFRGDLGKELTEEGTYKIVIDYPSNLLADGRYFLNVMLLNGNTTMKELANIGLINVHKQQINVSSMESDFTIFSKLNLDWEIIYER